MKIIITALTKEQKPVVKKNVEKFINKVFSKWDDFKRLKEVYIEAIVIPSNFRKELTQFQKSKGLFEGSTKTDWIEAVGKVVSYNVNDCYRATIFIDPKIIAGLFDSKQSQFSASIIIHEICHVMDDITRVGIFGLDFILKPAKDAGSSKELTLLLADALWSEYSASKLSALWLPEENRFSLLTDTLFGLLNSLKKNSFAEIEEYRYHADISKLLAGFILPNAHDTLKEASSLIGHLNGLKEASLTKKVNKYFSQNYFKIIWGELNKELTFLDNSPGDWKDVKVFEKLANVIINTWNLLGIFPEINDRPIEECCYVDVPLNKQIDKETSKL